MTKEKTLATERSKKRPALAVQRQPQTPTPKPSPVDATTGLATLEEGTDATTKARTMTTMQQSVGSTRLNRLLNRSVQAKPAAGAADVAEESTPDGQAQPVMRMAAGGPDGEEPGRTAVKNGQNQPAPENMIQRQPAQQPAPVTGPAPPPALTTAPLDPFIGASLLNTLDRFQNIPIDVPGIQTLPAGFVGPPAPVTVRVHVQAQYFINTSTARAHYAAARRSARFGDITRALAASGHVSLLESGGRSRNAGRAVELGKATPEDIKLFVEEALRQDIIRNYAIRHRDITRSQQLIDLAPADLQAVIQRWMRETGIGVDCSGFVQQAAIRAREEERALLASVNALTGAMGLPPIPLPPEISHEERPARSFTSGPRIRLPTDLQPGVAWVVSGGGHVRIVTGVREVTSTGGGTTIQFDTAESAGGSTQPEPGPVARTWQTHSRTTFHPITAVGHRGRSRGGTFHRIR